MQWMDGPHGAAGSECIKCTKGVAGWIHCSTVMLPSSMQGPVEHATAVRAAHASIRPCVRPMQAHRLNVTSSTCSRSRSSLARAAAASAPAGACCASRGRLDTCTRTVHRHAGAHVPIAPTPVQLLHSSMACHACREAPCGAACALVASPTHTHTRAPPHAGALQVHMRCRGVKPHASTPAPPSVHHSRGRSRPSARACAGLPTAGRDAPPPAMHACMPACVARVARAALPCLASPHPTRACPTGPGSSAPCAWRG